MRAIRLPIKRAASAQADAARQYAGCFDRKKASLEVNLTPARAEWYVGRAERAGSRGGTGNAFLPLKNEWSSFMHAAAQCRSGP
jgi:hypothetical protein